MKKNLIQSWVLIAFVYLTWREPFALAKAPLTEDGTLTSADLTSSLAKVLRNSYGFVRTKYGEPLKVLSQSENTVKAQYQVSDQFTKGTAKLEILFVNNTARYCQLTFPVDENINQSGSKGTFQSQLEQLVTAAKKEIEWVRAKRKASSILKVPLLRGRTDAERWSLVTNSILKLSELDALKVKAVFGEGGRGEMNLRNDIDNSCYYLKYQIEPQSTRLNKQCVEGAFLTIYLIGGKVRAVKLENEIFPLNSLVRTN
ncbi:MAG: hypothetical protein IPP57_17960 [Candidatus Obscuribacter sp.]|nr:hypothetical protein [Candidatus Obscuribacter sp.]MBK9772672.1 hypothetical protein [Candidatus Obscuribacter sp.]